MPPWWPRSAATHARRRWMLESEPAGTGGEATGSFVVDWELAPKRAEGPHEGGGGRRLELAGVRLMGSTRPLHTPFTVRASRPGYV